MPGPAGLKRAFFRILNYQNKLTPIRGNSKQKQKEAQKKGCFYLYSNKINMDPGDDFEVLRPFSNFSREIWNFTLFQIFWGQGSQACRNQKKSKLNCWPLHLSPRVVQRFSGLGEFRMPGPAGLKKAFFRILNFQNKLTPIRGKFEKPKKRRNKSCFLFVL